MKERIKVIIDGEEKIISTVDRASITCFNKARVVTFYKIRDKDTGLFSTGGYYPSWTKTGKSWKRLNHLKCHLNLWIRDDNGYVPKWRRDRYYIPLRWEVVRYTYRYESEEVVEL